jgi:hypothetical protein
VAISLRAYDAGAGSQSAIVRPLPFDDATRGVLERLSLPDAGKPAPEER